MKRGTGRRGGLPHPYQVKHRREETITIKSNPALHTHTYTNPFDGQIYFHLKRPSLKADFVAELRVVMFEQQPEKLCVWVPACVCVCIYICKYLRFRSMFIQIKAHSDLNAKISQISLAAFMHR